jgi:rhamnogalacturonyl hydrolase YesR
VIKDQLERAALAEKCCAESKDGAGLRFIESRRAAPGAARRETFHLHRRARSRAVLSELIHNVINPPVSLKMAIRRALVALAAAAAAAATATLASPPSPRALGELAMSAYVAQPANASLWEWEYGPSIAIAAL